MKTNASIKSIIKAVETVSNDQFAGNVVFMNKPKDLTKYVRRFTLRTKDVDGPGSMVTKAGQKQPKASWDVQEAVMNELLRINPDPSIYVDTVYGRKFATGKTEIEASQPDQSELNAELETVEQDQPEASGQRKKRKYTRKSKQPAEKLTSRKTGRKAKKSPRAARAVNGTGKLIKALKHLLKHPELLG